ncbi:SusC/RagA family TonB-linked outer membrane protein [Flavisolibacter nicotianae]|uniref:SusC/RagA family TonB-linked outer membrane protein n=1 Tax=Flavisolibacter nicotianae TaxID=2364882 RepID=UPI000EB385A7|nr:TonB-dependent receptor [Flavisolibacter nicotianae]
MRRSPSRVFSVKTFARICYALFLFLPFSLIAQIGTHTVSGTVLDSKNSPLQGVSVVVKGSSKGTTTLSDGRFMLENVPDNAVLEVSYTGYTPQQISVSGRTSISVTLAESANTMSDVVVIGYGTRQRKDVTGAVSQVKATQLENENPTSVQDVLRGNVPGLSVTSSPNAKGGGNLLVRGRSSINAGTSPLIVVDGVIYPGDLSDINPNDILTVDVLKDASSAAVYGAKAASGVILITTKKGSGSKPTITFNSNFGLATLAMNEPLYDGPGFIRWRTDVLKSINISNAKPYQFDDPRTLPSNISIDQWKAYDNSQGDPIDIWLTRLKLLPVERENYKIGKTTNWYNMMFQTGMRNDHTVSISGKKDEVSYYLSMNYTNNEGYIVGDKFSTFRTRVNVEARAAKFMTVGLNMQFADRDESQVPVTWGQMVNASPYGEVYKADGVTLRDSPNDDVGNNLNPFLDNTYTNRLQKYNTLFGSLYAKGNLPFGFSYQVNFTPNFEFYRYFNGISAKDFRYSVRKGVATRRDQTTVNWQMDNLLMWNKTFGDHKFDATFLVNAEKFQLWNNQMDNEGFDPNDKLSYHNIGAGIKPVVSSNDERSTGDALMARLNYAFRDKYLLTSSIRRDGYSAFGLQNPRATFPSIALGWVFSKESFVNARWLNYGKLRASWGINGNRDIGRYSALSNLTTGKYQYILPSGQILLISQLYVSRLQNPGLKWERTESYDIGLDYSLFNNRINGSIDVYRKSTKDLLINRALPDVTGFANVLDNLGEVQNRGIELSINTVNLKNRDFSWRSTANFTLNRNKIVHLYGPTPDYDATGKLIGQSEKDDVANRWFIGHEIDEIWDLKVLGVWQQNEATEAAKYGVKPGDFKIEDVNKDGKFSDADRQFLGYRSPRFQWTLRNDFTYKNFDFSFMIYSLWGQKEEFNQAKNNGGFIDRQNSYIVPYWTPENPINDYARLFSSNGSAGFSVYRKTSLIRLSTLALAYTLPEKLVSRAKIQGLKFYVNVNNVAVYQPDWIYWDAEYRVNPPSDRSIIPPPRYYTFGINLTL